MERNFKITSTVPLIPASYAAFIDVRRIKELRKLKDELDEEIDRMVKLEEDLEKELAEKELEKKNSQVSKK